MPSPGQSKPRFLVPEVIQTSEMDCGPASLKALLEGFGISASYGRLREACHTSVDGTSIDAIEDLANRLGLEAEQIMLPYDHVLLKGLDVLPALVVTRTPGGLTHFVLAWSQHGPWVQVMDPGVGRRFVTRRRFIEDLFRHSFPVPLASWREWAATPGFQAPLQRRLLAVVQAEDAGQDLLAEAAADPGWRPLAALDASVRLVGSLVEARAIVPGPEAAALVQSLYRHNAPVAREEGEISIPPAYWSVTPGPDAGTLLLYGAVLVRVYGLREGAALVPEELPEDLSPILAEPPVQVERRIWEELRREGGLVPGLVAAGFAIAAIGTTLQAGLMQLLMRLQELLPSPAERLAGLAALLLFLGLLFLLEIPLETAVQRLGRRLEARFRIAFLEKLPRLSDRYFHSRLTSDMLSRANSLHTLASLPALLGQLIAASFRLLLTAAGVIWLQPALAGMTLAAVALFAGLGWVSRAVLEESDMRTRVHAGALSRFYLEALQGLLPLRTHGAERAFRREHEGLLLEWLRSDNLQNRASLALGGLSALLYALYSAWVGATYVRTGGASPNGLLLFYWTLSLPLHGQNILSFFQQYPMLRNGLLRILEPLDAPEEGHPAPAEEPAEPVAPPHQGVAIRMERVSVVAGGLPILQEVDLQLAPGEELAVVGPSGAGKSSLVGLLLGWHQPAAGRCLVDGCELTSDHLQALRRATVWVDPEVQLWNRSLLDNLTYGNDPALIGARGLVLEQADLGGLFERLDNGLQTVLGEGGGLVSGGEGQRVRLARGMNRTSPRLVILDEPFRGLDREQRRRLLARSRAYWQGATLICVTHDVGETQDFDRVVVVEGGRLVEDGAPSRLSRRKTSRYRQLLESERQVREGLWTGGSWRHLRMEDGVLGEEPGAAS